MGEILKQIYNLCSKDIFVISRIQDCLVPLGIPAKKHEWFLPDQDRKKVYKKKSVYLPVTDLDLKARSMTVAAGMAFMLSITTVSKP